MSDYERVELADTVDLLLTGLRMPDLAPELARYIEPVETCCALTGARITQGIPVRRVVSSNTGEFLDLTSGVPTGYFSLSAARAFKGAWNLGSILVFADGPCYRPLISSANAAGTDRPVWSALVRAVWPKYTGVPCLCILATDVKKKVWPLASVGPLGVHTPALLFDSSRNLLGVWPVDWPRLLAVLDFVETLYSRGYTKAAIADNLLVNLEASERLGLTTAYDYEQHLAALRGSPEFNFSIIVAQKGE